MLNRGRSDREAPLRAAQAALRRAQLSPRPQRPRSPASIGSGPTIRAVAASAAAARLLQHVQRQHRDVFAPGSHFGSLVRARLLTIGIVCIVNAETAFEDIQAQRPTRP